ncbi:ABC transporter permease [Cognatishimia sp. WU-CL00825]|uniref:ABC transporter permease n=1 Tax=Cognatishimia sp. WU-CL00825 TaxID=3127658 RepID=UPI003104D7C2
MPGDIVFPATSTPPSKHPRRKFASLRAVLALILREMTTAYGRSPGGYMWSIVEPAAAITLLTIIFSLGFRSPPLGNNFAIFYASGMLPFMAYNNVSGTVASAINYSKSLLAYPSVTYIDAIFGRFLLNMMTQMLVSLILITGILWFFETRTTLELLKILLAFSLTASLALGIGTLNCFLASMYPVWQRIWSVVTRPLFLISGIIFLLETVPQPFRDFLWYNPLVHIIAIMRSAFYTSYDAPWASPLYVMIISSVSFTVGLVFLHRYHREILHR